MIPLMKKKDQQRPSLNFAAPSNQTSSPPDMKDNIINKKQLITEVKHDVAINVDSAQQEWPTASNSGFTDTSHPPAQPKDNINMEQPISECQHVEVSMKSDFTTHEQAASS